MVMLRHLGVPFAILSLVFCWNTVGNAFQCVSLQNIGAHQWRNELFASPQHQDMGETLTTPEVNRRSALTCAAATMTFLSTIPAIADDALAPITNKVYMDVRISRSDGTFYVRDDLPDLPENRVFYGRLVFGLYGTKAPTTVERFLSYVTVAYNPLDDNPLPSYGRSTFRSLEQATGKKDSSILMCRYHFDSVSVFVIRFVGRWLYS